MITKLDSAVSQVNAADTGDATVTPGTSPTWSSWTQLIASTARRSTHGILSIVPPVGQNFGTFLMEVEIGIGGAGSEVNLFGSHLFLTSPSSAQLPCSTINTPFLMEVAPGVRISFRARMTDTPNGAARVVLTLQGRA